MKEIIIYLVIIAGGLLFDFIKKKIKKSSDSVQVNEPSKSTPWEANEEFAFLNPLGNPFHQHSSEQYVNPEMNGEVSSEVVPIKEVHHEPSLAKTPKSPAAKHRKFDSLQRIETVGQPVIEESQIAPSLNPEEQNTELVAHYARWRQAIIDAQIIQRKF